MKLVELLEKYCEKYDDEYITHDHCFDIVPASEEELKTFEEHCHKYHRQICQGHDGIHRVCGRQGTLKGNSDQLEEASYK